jgi:small GTP-binding protein
MSGISAKVVILGDSAIGKTSLIQRYISGRADIQNSTLGAVFVKLEHNFKNEQGKNFNLPIQFWDTAGQERYNALIPMYVRDADFIILAFDLTNTVSFINLYRWLNFGNNTVKNTQFVLVGCKNDLTNIRRVTDEEIESFIKKNLPSSKFFKCSAMTGENIHELFLHIKLGLEKIGENRIIFNSMDNNNRHGKKIVRIDDYDRLFSDNSFIELVRVKKKCCF